MGEVIVIDVAHEYGSDLTVGPTGDIAIASGEIAVQQRLLRRLLTNPGEYIWNPTYGAGLGRFVGSPIEPAQIGAVIRSQIIRENAIARVPAPEIIVSTDRAGSAYVEIRYAEAITGSTQLLEFKLPIGAP